MNSRVTSLNLGGSFSGSNRMGEGGGRAIAEALRVNTTVTSLNLCGNDIGERGVQAIAEALRVNSTVTSLNLERNDLHYLHCA